MSEYGYEDRRHSRRVRERSPEYVTETTYIQRGNPPSRELVYRPRDREDSIEDIPRDFPPPNAEYRRTKYRDEYPPPRRARSAGRRGYYDDGYYDDYAPAAGAAAYAAAARPRNRRRESEYYSDDDYDRPPRRERRKSRVEEMLDDVGLGGVAAVVTKQLRSKSRGRRHRSHSRDDDSSDSDRSTRSRPRSKSRDARKKWQQAAKAAVIAGATEAVRSRKEPGGWGGAKGQRIATAALSAAGIDGFLDKDPEHHSKRHVLEAVAGGLAANRLANGPRDQSASRGGDVSPSGRSRSRSRSIVDRLRSRSRSVLNRGRSQSRGGSDKEGGGGGSSNFKKVAALGGVAAAGKAIYDRVRSKSRGRRAPSASSDDSYVPSRRQRYNRDRGDPDNGSDDAQGGPPRGREEEQGEDTPKRDSSVSTVSTEDLENRRKRTRGKELVTAGLATVATIHAAHGVYSSMVASEKRHKLVLEGEMTPQDARKRKSKNMLQDAAAVGIAAMSIKSAFGEWEEMNEQREQLHELEAKRRRRKKERERREQQARMNPFGMMGGGANGFPLMYPVPFPQQQQQQQQMQPMNAGPASYQDGNPYGGSIPPPPMGAPPQNRY